MPIDASIPLQAAKASPPLGAAAAQPNFLQNPGALQNLLQMGGNLAAGRAIQGAVGENGLDVNAALQSLAKDPAAAYGALEAVGKIQSIANAQQERSQKQNDEGKSALASLMALGDKMTEKDYTSAINDAAKRGLISPELAATFISQTPRNQMTGGFDQPAAMKNVGLMFLQRLDGPQQGAFINGQPLTIRAGDVEHTIMLPKVPGIVNPYVVTTPIGQSPESKIPPVNTGKVYVPGTGVVDTTAPGGQVGKEIGVPQAPAPQVSGQRDITGRPSPVNQRSVPGSFGTPPEGGWKQTGQPGPAAKSAGLPGAQQRLGEKVAAGIDPSAEVDRLGKLAPGERAAEIAKFSARQKQLIRAELEKRAQK